MKKHPTGAHKFINRVFCTFAEQAASLAGTPAMFILALAFVLVWGFSGTIFHFSKDWKSVFEVVPGIFTFLLVFLIQNSQNRETRAVQLKLNELIRATAGAHTLMVNLEKYTYEELKIISEEYELLAEEARRRVALGQTDKGVPEIAMTPELPITILK